MEPLIIYDSAYGNTESIARAIGRGIAVDVRTIHVREADSYGLDSVDFLIVGSPTQGGRATPAIQNFLEGIPESALKGKCVAAFDTRLPTKFVGIFGYAAGRIADILRAKGCTLVASPEGFMVKGKEGPLKEGEEERASKWGKELNMIFQRKGT